MLNTPNVNLGIITIANYDYDQNEANLIREKLSSELSSNDVKITNCKAIISSEVDAIKALSELKSVNSLVLVLCNHINESAAAILIQKFDGPVMIVGAKDENNERLQNNSRDTYASILSINYSLSLRNLKAYIPDLPVTNLKGMVEQIRDFIDIARIWVSIKKLKIISFGPRPYNCFSTIQPVLDMGIEIEENSDLDLIKSYHSHLDDPRVSDLAKEIVDELDEEISPGLVAKLSAYELTLIDWYLARRGASKYAIFSIKCGIPFIRELGFCPCIVHARLSSKGIIVACNDDIYGALSGYISLTSNNKPSALININNNVPKDIYKQLETDYKNSDLFIGLSCGNIPLSLLANSSLSYNKLLHREIEPNEKPNTTIGTIKGDLKSDDITLLRIMPNKYNQLQAYIVEGKTLDYDLTLEGCGGIIAIEGMAKFYKEVLIDRCFNQHTTISFAHNKRILLSALRLLNVDNIY